MSIPAPGEAPILSRLRDVGYEVESLADLRHSGIRYVEAVPILIAALAVDEPRTLEEVVRALSVPWAKPTAVAPLINAFKSVAVPSASELNSARWAIGNALGVLWDDAFFDELVELARDQAYSRDREMIVLGLSKSRRAEAGDVLIELLDDPAVNGHAVKALAKLKLQRAKPGLQRMTSDRRAWVRAAAEGALKKLT